MLALNKFGFLFSPFLLRFSLPLNSEWNIEKMNIQQNVHIKFIDKIKMISFEIDMCKIQKCFSSRENTSECSQR